MLQNNRFELREVSYDNDEKIWLQHVQDTTFIHRRILKGV